jgi:hypothetical protein
MFFLHVFRGRLSKLVEPTSALFHLLQWYLLVFLFFQDIVLVFWFYHRCDGMTIVWAVQNLYNSFLCSCWYVLLHILKVVTMRLGWMRPRCAWGEAACPQGTPWRRSRRRLGSRRHWHRKVKILSFVTLKSVDAMTFYTVLCCVLSLKASRLFDIDASFVLWKEVPISRLLLVFGRNKNVEISYLCFLELLLCAVQLELLIPAVFFCPTEKSDIIYGGFCLGWAVGRMLARLLMLYIGRNVFLVWASLGWLTDWCCWSEVDVQSVMF